MLVNVVHIVILLLEFIIILIPNLCDLLLMIQVDALNIKLKFVRLAFLVIDLFFQSFFLIAMSSLEGFDLILMALSERDHLFLRMLFPKGLVLPVTHHDGFIHLPIFGLFLLVLSYLSLKQFYLLKEDASISAVLFLFGI